MSALIVQTLNVCITSAHADAIVCILSAHADSADATGCSLLPAPGAKRQ